MPEPKPLFQSSKSTPKTGGARLALYALTLAAVGGAILYFKRLSAEAGPDVAPSASAAPVATQRTPKDVPVPGGMKAVAGGKFKMGSEDGDPDEKPITEAEVAPFQLDVTEVTVKAYAACVSGGKCTEPDKSGDCNWGRADRVDNPVNCVDHGQAEAYCAFVGRRLPTEAEWEFAARGADGRKFPWSGGDPTKQLCWNGEGNDVGKSGRRGTCAVGSYPDGASPFGMLDMAGNVWEWTASPYCPYDKPDCGDERRVIRGGAWNNLVPAFVRSADRSKETVATRNGNIGFRCAK